MKGRPHSAQARFSSLLRALGKDAAFYSERHTEVSPETGERITQNLQKLRQVIERLKGMDRLYPIKLVELERARSDALLYAQAFHIEYDKLAVLHRLRRQRSLHWMFTECVEEGRRACEAIKKEQEGATNEH